MKPILRWGTAALIAIAGLNARAELGQGLVAYYPFDTPGETQPNRATALTGTSFPNDSAALIQQATITAADPRAGAGALLLGGAGDYVDIVGNPVNINADWTVSIWFRPNTNGLGLDVTAGFQVFETSGAFPISYALRGDGGTVEETRMEMASEANVATGFPSNYLMADNQVDQWHHILITYDSAASVMRGYLDGVVRHVASVDGLAAYSGFHIGTTRLANDRWFKGLMDEIAIWQRTLSAEEVAQVYALGSGGRTLFIDSDSDGLADSWEIDQFGDLNQTADGDPDMDGLVNGREYANDTSPTNPDTDGDGLNDGPEVDLHGTNPALADTDGDGINDGDELHAISPTNPTLADTDGDGLNDGLEKTHQTDGTLQDTDGDGFTDFVEIAGGSNPRDPLNYPSSVPVTGIDHVIISEFVANSWNGVNDEDLESPDWIELWNPTAAIVDLAGWHLTDDPTAPTKWTFPARKLNPGGRLLVFASGKNRTSGGNLHTNFELSADGGYLALTNPGGVVVSVFENYGEQRVNVSYGFFGASAPLVAGWLGTPTPGKGNPSIGLVERVKDTAFSVKRGLFDAPFSVTVTCPTRGATLAYTLDGTMPSAAHGVQVPASSNEVTPSVTLPVSTTTTLRVLAHKTGLLETNVDTQTYLFPAQVLTQSGPPPGSESLAWGRLGPDWAMDPEVVGSPDPAVRIVASDLAAIPSVSLVLPFADMWGTNGIYPEGEGIPRDASFEILNPAGSKTEPNAIGGYQARGQVHIFGGSTAVRWKMDKLSMRFRFADDLREQVFSDSAVRRFSTLVLDARSNNTWNHPIADQRTRGDYARDEVTADLQNAMGGFAPHSQYVHLYINGLYWGMYTLHERPDHHFAQEYLGGTDAEYSAQKHDLIDVIRGPIRGGVPSNMDYLMLLVLANADLSVRANYEALAAKLDVEDFIRYMLLNYVAGNWDWAQHNWYATYNRVRPEGRWRFHSWDAEHTWRDLGEDFTGKDDPQGPTHIQQRLQLNAEYRLRFADGIHRYLFNGGQLTSAAVQRAFEKRLGSINEAIRGESARWGDNYDISFARTRRTWLREAARILGYVAPFPNNPEFGVPPGAVLPGQSAAILTHFRNRGWYPNAAAASGWRLEAPEFSRHGGNVPGGFSLTMRKTPANGPGTLLYTMDGTDPRIAFTGAVGPSAKTYASAIALTGSIQIKARVFDGANWSPLTDAFFTVDVEPASAANLVVSEMMYHPLAPTPEETTGGFGDENDFEFFELLNISGKMIDLSGVKISGGISFAFDTLPLEARLLPAGSRLVLAENPNALAMRSGRNASGAYTGNLSNGGERLVITAASGAIIRDFAYSDSEPWPSAADGSGCSLVLNNPYSAPDHAIGSNWRASASPGGAPGLADSLPMPANPLGDDDGDGMCNLIAYATAGNPDAEVSRAPLALVEQPGDYLIFQYRLNRAADGFAAVPEISTDLSTWSTDCVLLGTTWHTDGTATLYWRTAKPCSELGGRVFARVRFRIE